MLKAAFDAPARAAGPGENGCAGKAWITDPHTQPCPKLPPRKKMSWLWCALIGLVVGWIATVMTETRLVPGNIFAVMEPEAARGTW